MLSNNIVAIDTNLYLDDSNILYKLGKKYDKILVPIIVLRELDKHKFNPDLSFSARNAIHSILNYKRENPEKIVFDVSAYNTGHNNDDEIISSAIAYGAVLATKDVSMSIIAEAKGLIVELYDVVLNNIFKPYLYTSVGEFFTEDDLVFTYEQIYSGDKYDILIEYLKNKKFKIDYTVNDDSWFYIFIEDHVANENSVQDIIVYAHNPKNKIIERIDNNPKYREFEIDGNRKVKSRDIYQNCLIYALKEAEHVLITGSWGTGKTLMGTSYALTRNSRKTFITRPPAGINKKYELGYLPGDKDSKMLDWCSGFLSALYYIYYNTRGQSDDKLGSAYDYVKDRIFKEKFEILPINMIQGLSLLNDDVLIVDEVQLIDVNYMSMILSRPCESGKLILLGDLKQTYNVVKPSESGLLKLLRILPHKSLAYVELKNQYRSDLLELADKLQDKTIG